MMALEPEIREALGEQLASADAIRFPLVCANRGTFTVTVRSGSQDLAVLRLDAARKLVAHESAALEAVARSGEDLASTVPRVIWKGALGKRAAALQSFMCGTLQRFAGTPAALQQQLDTLSPWLVALTCVPTDQMGHPHLDESLALYESAIAFAGRVQEAAIGRSFWASVDRLGGWHLVMSHGDLHPGNILTSGNNLAVLDWEYAAARPSAFDWAHYIAASLFDRPDRPRSSRRDPGALLFDIVSVGSPWGRAIHTATCAHLERLTLDPAHAADYLRTGLWDFLWRRFRYHDYATLARRLFADE